MDSPTWSGSVELTCCSGATEGVEAVRAAVQDGAPFAVAFLDLSMPPGPGGDWAAQQIRELDPAINIVIVTGCTDVDSERIAASVPPRDRLLYVQKPFYPHEIRHFAVALCAKWEAERLLRGSNMALQAQVTARTEQLASVNAQLREDIRRRQAAEEALAASEQRYALAARGANDGLWDWNLVSQKAFFSERWRSMLGVSNEEPCDTPAAWLDRSHPDDRQQLEASLQAHVEGRSEHFEEEHRVRHADGTYRWLLCRGLAVRDDAGRAVRLAGSMTDVTRRRNMEEALVHKALHDTLTGLANRFFFVERLARALQQARSTGRHDFAVVFFDLDRFKVVNDSLGHAAGDDLLKSVGRRREASLRATDTLCRFVFADALARFGGDEFTVLLEELGGPEDAIRVVRRLLAALERPFLFGDREVYTSASAGIALAAPHYERPEEVLRDADIAMYRAKGAGDAHYAVFDADMHARAVRLLELETELRRALERDQFELHFQPVLELERGEPVGFEALLRWRHPERGLLLPGAFIGVLEQSGLMQPIGRWVLNTACQAAARFNAGRTGPPLHVAVNIAASQVADPEFGERVRAALVSCELPAKALKLEITERALLTQDEAVSKTVAAIDELGVDLHMDDFGTGYSALSYLHRFSFRVIKIDRSFIGRLPRSRESLEVVRTIIQLAHNLGMRVVGEGVERPEQLRALEELGCDYGQGFLLCRPLDPVAAEVWAQSDQPWRRQP